VSGVVRAHDGPLLPGGVSSGTQSCQSGGGGGQEGSGRQCASGTQSLSGAGHPGGGLNRCPIASPLASLRADALTRRSPPSDRSRDLTDAEGSILPENGDRRPEKSGHCDPVVMGADACCGGASTAALRVRPRLTIADSLVYTTADFTTPATRPPSCSYCSVFRIASLIRSWGCNRVPPRAVPACAGRHARAGGSQPVDKSQDNEG
jgi:hypothetical protein